MHEDPQQIAAISASQDIVIRGVLQDMFERATPQIYVVDAESLRILTVNAEGRKACNGTLRGLRHRRPWDIFPTLKAERVVSLMRWVRTRQSTKVEFLIRPPSADGRTYVTTIMYQTGFKPSFVITVRDISKYAQFRYSARIAEDWLAASIDSLADGFVIYDADDRLVMCNQTYCDFYSESAPAIVPGARFEDILRFGLSKGQYSDAIGREEEWLQDRIAAHRSGDIEIEQRLKDGRWLRIIERGTIIGGRVGLRIDITAQKQQEQLLSELAITDDLTGLRNRRGLAKEVAALAGSKAENERIAVLHIDLDRFKIVNDVFGHDAGDFVLRTCAEILKGGRKPPQIVARVGGDEFALVLATRKRNAEILRYVRMLSNRIAEPINYQGHLCGVGASVGVSFVKGRSVQAAADALTEADIAMNHSKRTKGAGFSVFEPQMREQTRRNSKLAQEMKDGLGRNEFVPFFQPQFNARTGKIMGFEALLRWLRPENDPVPADEFLKIAQNAGLTDDLDNIVMAQSCEANRKLMDWGFKDPCVSLNMSMAQISDVNLISRLTQYMNEYRVSHQNLRIELLESTLLDERAANIVENVHAMIRAGFQVELDDFGTGHAAIATLRKFAVSQIKIDRSLIRFIDRDKDLQMITGAIVDLAQNLGIGVLAEGVETQAEQDMLLGINCDAAQGYLHARPMSLDRLKQFLEARGDIPSTCH